MSLLLLTCQILSSYPLQTSNVNKVAAPSSPSSSSTTQPSRGNAAMNRNSVIPLSPGISSAVNYMTLYDQSSPVSPPSHVPSPPSSTETRAKDREADKPTEREIEPEKEKENQHQSKESWRKSDSTNSHHTIRPAARNSRPVSWAESFQSAHTVVGLPSATPNQANSSSSPRSRPRSALIGDPDFRIGELEEEDSEVDANGPDDAGDVFPIDRVPAVPPKAIPPASASDHKADVAKLDPSFPSAAHPIHTSSSLVGTISSHPATFHHSMQSTPSAVGNSISSGSDDGSACGNHTTRSRFEHNGINQSQHQISNSNMSMNAGAPTSTTSSMAGSSSTSASPSVNASGVSSTGSSAVHLHNQRVLPSLPTSSSASSPLPSGSVLTSGPSSYPHSHSFSHSYPYSSSTPGPVQHPHISESNHNHNNTRTPLQPVRQQLSMPNPPPSSPSNVRRSGQQRHYEYQYPLQLPSTPQSSQSHTRHPQQQPRAQTVSLSSPSTSSSGMGMGMMGSTVQSAAAGLAKRAVEKMGMGRRWAMGLAGGHGGESDREMGGTGNWSTSSASASGTRRGNGGSNTSGYSSSSSGSMFESGRSGSIDGGVGRRPHSNSISHPISHPTPIGQGGSPNTPKFLQNTTSKIIHVHANRSKGRHTGGTPGSVSSVSSDSHSSDMYGGGPSSSSPSPSPSPSPSSFGIQPVNGPNLGIKIRAGAYNASVMGTRARGAMSAGGAVFKRSLSACVRDTNIRVGVASNLGGIKEKERATPCEDSNGSASVESGAKGRKRGSSQGRRGDLVAELETRKLPALVVRCAQHLLLWGIHEEGLFRCVFVSSFLFQP